MPLIYSLEVIAYDPNHGAYGEPVESRVANFSTIDVACRIAFGTMEDMRDNFVEILKKPSIRNSIPDEFISGVRLGTLCEGRFVYVLRWDGVIIFSARVFRRNAGWLKVLNEKEFREKFGEANP